MERRSKFLSSNVGCAVKRSGSKERVIERDAFYSCWGLKITILPASLTVVDGSCFCQCGLSNIEIGTGNSHLGIPDKSLAVCARNRIIRYFGDECKVVIPDRIETVGLSSLASCKSVICIASGLHSRVRSFEHSSFDRCLGFSSICHRGSVEIIGQCCIANCSKLARATLLSNAQLFRREKAAFFLSPSLRSFYRLSSSLTDPASGTVRG
jgi:hypothetical protein